MNPIKLNKSEKEILGNYFKTSPILLMRLKSQAILMYDSKFNTSDIAIALMRTQRSIQRWLSDFKLTRISSIFSGHTENENASKLTKEQKEEISKVLLNPPNEYGLPQSFWDVPSLKKYVKATFKVEYESDTSYLYLLHFSNLSFKYPDKFDANRDDTLIQKRMKEIHDEITKYQRSSNWEIFCSDEVGLRVDRLTRKAWLIKGEKTVVKVERGKEQRNFIGMLNQKTNDCHIYQISSGNEKEMIRTLKILCKKYPDKNICIIWDNAACHKSKKLREELSKGNSLERIHLVALPPYAPDHNPIEHVWKYAKDQVSNILERTIDETVKKFFKVVNNTKFDYKI